MPATQYYFCEARNCDVVYFALDPQAPVFRRGDLWVPVGAKEAADQAQVCYCFVFTRKDIENEIAGTGQSTVADRITAEVKAGNCACEVKESFGQMLSGRCHARSSGLFEGHPMSKRVVVYSQPG
jgi:NAD(P)H-nitrite reductase large subunit